VANKNRTLVPEAEQALNKMKFEVANSINVKLKPDYNGDLTSRQAGSVGGEMVKRMIQQYEQNMSAKTTPRR
jgi:small acid-soluble spore protein D (minor alpha/beta-type SASP)